MQCLKLNQTRGYIKLQRARCSARPSRPRMKSSPSVRDFVGAACKALSIEIQWKGKGLEEIGVDSKGNTIISINKKFFRPNEVDYLLGDSKKALKDIGWKPEISFGKLVEMMVHSDLDHLRTRG